jgi:hypothetical protein
MNSPIKPYTVYLYDIMVSPGELRKGNYFSGNFRDQWSVIKIRAMPLYSYDVEAENGKEYSLANLEAIPLSPEILLKCGFKFDSDELSDGENKVIVEKYILEYFEWYQKSKELFYREVNLPHIKYLHKLQNIYFDLIGEELNVQL